MNTHDGTGSSASPIDTIGILLQFSSLCRIKVVALRQRIIEERVGGPRGNLCALAKVCGIGGGTTRNQAF